MGVDVWQSCAVQGGVAGPRESIERVLSAVKHWEIAVWDRAMMLCE